VSETVKGRCGFCGLGIYVNKERREILHEMPPCEEFLKEEDPATFLERSRKKREN
jgi:hypothetical protein